MIKKSDVQNKVLYLIKYTKNIRKKSNFRDKNRCLTLNKILALEVILQNVRNRTLLKDGVETCCWCFNTNRKFNYSLKQTFICT